MSELRKNVLTGDWTIIAPERARRPSGRLEGGARPAVPVHVPDCPFCPGNEARTPPPVLEVPDSSGQRWQARAFANRFAALSPGAAPDVDFAGSLHPALPGTGEHLVIVESPRHDAFPASRSVPDWLPILEAYRGCSEALAGNPNSSYVIVFKNHGEGAGTSLEHPHAQAIAMPILPEHVERRCRNSIAHFEALGRCLLCDIVREELIDGVRIVAANDSFLAFEPFAASRPAETWIVPLRHEPEFQRIRQAETEALASLMAATLRSLRESFADPDFNYVVHSAPRECPEPAAQHWYLQIVPRMTRMAGFELGSGVQINPLAPEEAASRLRRTL